jgi:hypothetical protein
LGIISGMHDNSGMPHRAFIEGALGISTENARKLAKMNDTGLPFAQIAREARTMMMDHGYTY